MSSSNTTWGVWVILFDSPVDQACHLHFSVSQGGPCHHIAYVSEMTEVDLTANTMTKSLGEELNQISIHRRTDRLAIHTP